MGSELKASRNGYKLVIDIPKRPLPPTKNVFPVPTPGQIGSSYLTLSTVAVEGNTRKAIRVQISTLPGPTNTVWTLYHLAYQGSIPNPAHYETIPVAVVPDLDFKLLDPSPDSHHSLYLSSTLNSITTTYNTENIDTPVETVQESILHILSDGWITAGTEKISYQADFAVVTAQHQSLLNQAASVFANISGTGGVCYEAVAYDATYIALASLESYWSDAGVDTDISLITPSLQTQWENY